MGLLSGKTDSVAGGRVMPLNIVVVMPLARMSGGAERGVAGFISGRAGREALLACDFSGRRADGCGGSRPGRGNAGHSRGAVARNWADGRMRRANCCADSTLARRCRAGMDDESAPVQWPRRPSVRRSRAVVSARPAGPNEPPGLSGCASADTRHSVLLEFCRRRPGAITAPAPDARSSSWRRFVAL